MLTRRLRIVAIAAFAFALPAVAHQVEIPAAVAGVATAVAGDIVLTGTVKQLVVEDRTTGTTTTYRTLRQDDGTALELTGTLAASLEVGARAQITGQQSGSKLAMTQVQSLAALPSVAVATTSSQVQGTLTLAHSDNFAAGHGEFSYVVRPQGGGRAVPLVLDLMPDTLKNGMQVLASGNVAAGAVSLDANYITIIAPAVPKRSAAQSLTPLALTTNNLLVILVKFSDSPTTDPFTQAQVDAVVRTNPNSVASYYNEVSYSKEQLNATVTPWLQTGVATPASCDYTTIGNLADTAATAAGYTGTYQNRFYVFPRESACGWAGLAYVSFGEAWSNGYNQLSVYAHELGHNFGLLHAGSLDCGSVTLPYPTTGCGASEYGDPFVVMGNQSAGHFDALQKTLIDAPSGPWIAAAGVKTHTSGTVTYTLGPIESAGVSTYAVKIPTTASNRTYWLEYRQPVGLFDTFISAANSGLHVRVASPFEVSSGADDTEIIDMTPGSASAFSNAALLPGLTYVDNQYNVTISVLSATPGAAGAMTVQVTTPGSGTSTTTAVASSANPSAFGASVTFTATITGNSPTGTVGFTNNGISISGCTAQAVSAAKATCTTSALTAGSHSIVATYSGDAGNNTSTSPTLTQTVNKAATSTTLASSANPSTYGASVTFTATVTGSAPTGTVGFTDNGVSISGCTAQTVSAAKATCATTALTVGAHSIVATYSGDAGNNTSTSPTLTQTVNKAASSTTLASSANPSTYGASVTFTATVTGSAPTGTVGFTDNGSAISGCTAQPVSAGKATCTTSALTVGSHSIVATYSGDANNNGSTSSTLSQTVNSKTASSTTLAASPNPSTSGSTVTFTATVAGSAPTGTVGFTSDGSAISGCTAQALSAGKATCTTAALTLGSHSIVATYAGDANNNGSASPALTQTVNSVAGSTNVALAANGGVASASSTYSAGYPVSAINNGDRTGAGWGNGGGWNDATASTYPDWVQIVFNGQKTIDHVVVVTLQDNYASPVQPTASTPFTLYGVTDFSVQAWNGSSWVTLGTVAGNNLVMRTVNFTAVTTDRIRVNITGALASYSRLVEVEAYTVGAAAAPTTTTLASSANPSASGSSVTFTAAVAGSAPTGNVGFTDNGSAISGCAAQALSAGNATCTTAALTVGSHSIVATYSGDANNNGSTSSTLSQTVNSKTASSTTLAASPNPSTSGSTVTFTATVAGSAPTGTVGFTSDGSAISGCTAQALSAGKATCTTAALTLGSQSIVATYAGDANNNGSASPALTQTVNSVAGSTNVALAANGGVASASSTYSKSYPASAINNGDRTGAGWGNGGGWNDATASTYPDWVQIVFNGQKTIDHVVVVTLQDNYASPVQPTASTPFTLYGVTDFSVQAWNGSSWVTLGTVAGNNLVMRTVNFTAVTTDRIRVNITGALASYSRLVEVEAWGN